ncbi:sensor histidine kinase [Flavobacterium gilvum]|nr:histidine kinase [Flavobacterium gilvum]
MVLIPIKLEERNNGKYLWYTLGCIFVFTILELRFFSAIMIRHADPSHNIFGIDTRNLFHLKQLINVFAAISIPLIIIGVLSFFHALSVYGKKKLLPYLEILFHTIILLGIFTFSVLMPQMRTKEILVTSFTLIVFYTHAFLITPVLITEKKKLKYGFLLIVLCASYYVFMIKVFGIPKFDQETGNPASYENIFSLIFIISCILFMTLFLSFIYGYSRLKIIAKEKSFDLKLGAKESELNLLKSQVNPHFLFNSLNTLYATALTENAPKTGESIAKLASLIRYMQEDINKDFIPLENEIKYLQDYIAIQKLRCAVEPQVETHFENFENHSISPGLLIPFVENAFKYGIDPSKASKLEVSVYCDDNRITFECVNSYDEDYKTYYKEQGFGIGIENAKQRLELVYPKKHTFEIVKENNIFSVKIVINTSKK